MRSASGYNFGARVAYEDSEAEIECAVARPCSLVELFGESCCITPITERIGACASSSQKLQPMQLRSVQEAQSTECSSEFARVGSRGCEDLARGSGKKVGELVIVRAPVTGLQPSEVSRQRAMDMRVGVESPQHALDGLSEAALRCGLVDLGEQDLFDVFLAFPQPPVAQLSGIERHDGS